MTDIKADTDHLNQFATAAGALAGELRGLVPKELTTANTPDIGQSVNAFTDAMTLYQAYEVSRRELIGDGSQGTDDLSTLINKVTTLASAASTIAANYTAAKNEDYNDATTLYQAQTQTTVPVIPGA